MLQQNDPGRKWWRRWIWRKSSQGSQASLGSLGWYHQIQMNVFSRRWFKQDRAGTRFFLLQVCWGSSWWSWNCGHLLNKAREWLQLGIIPKNCTVAPEELLKSLRTQRRIKMAAHPCIMSRRWDMLQPQRSYIVRQSTCQALGPKWFLPLGCDDSQELGWVNWVNGWHLLSFRWFI